MCVFVVVVAVVRRASRSDGLGQSTDEADYSSMPSSSRSV